MSETTTNNKSDADNASKDARPPMARSATMPSTPTSPLATNPWYQQKFELFRDVIEEKVRDQYPNLPPTHKLEPANIELSTLKGFDLDFPVELHDGQSATVSLAYGKGPRPPYSKEERRSLVTVRQNTIETS